MKDLIIKTVDIMVIAFVVILTLSGFIGGWVGADLCRFRYWHHGVLSFFYDGRHMDCIYQNAGSSKIN